VKTVSDTKTGFILIHSKNINMSKEQINNLLVRNKVPGSIRFMNMGQNSEKRIYRKYNFSII
jgi:hypothetical protein